MICKFCGGDINLSVGRCIVCGKPIDESSDIRTVHGVDSMAERYGILDEDSESDIPDLLTSGTYRRTRGTYEDVKVERQYYGPSLGLDEYRELLGEDSESSVATDDPHAPSNVPRNTDTPDQSDDEAGVSIVGRLVEKTNSEFISKAYHKTHDILSPPIEKVLEVYHESFPQMNRVKKNRSGEKLAVLGTFMLILVLAVGLILLISSNIAPSVKGEWLAGETSAGERLTIEFTSHREVIVRTYTDGVPHIYQRGTYQKHRRNKSNMLIITYEDGSTTRLYYELHHNTGTFTNVDSNQTAQYTRIG